MSRPHISYVPLENMDERMQEEMHRCAREGTPRPRYRYRAQIEEEYERLFGAKADDAEDKA